MGEKIPQDEIAKNQDTFGLNKDELVVKAKIGETVIPTDDKAIEKVVPLDSSNASSPFDASKIVPLIGNEHLMTARERLLFGSTAPDILNASIAPSPFKQMMDTMSNKVDAVMRSASTAWMGANINNLEVNVKVEGANLADTAQGRKFGHEIANQVKAELKDGVFTNMVENVTKNLGPAIKAKY